MYRYQGSLTGPPCHQNISWTVFRDTVPVSLKQLSYFGAIYRNNSTKLNDNARTLQPMKDRVIYARNCPLLKMHSGSGDLEFRTTFVAILVIVSSFGTTMFS